ncbi:hypothetical protein OH77DRAFT_283630 [Trametes cingulata]|nr:hypothetical protein OH77DRAFT_283630 [Trametes cingulata]
MHPRIPGALTCKENMHHMKWEDVSFVAFVTRSVHEKFYDMSKVLDSGSGGFSVCRAGNVSARDPQGRSSHAHSRSCRTRPSVACIPYRTQHCRIPALRETVGGGRQGRMRFYTDLSGMQPERASILLPAYRAASAAEQDIDCLCRILCVKHCRCRH